MNCLRISASIAVFVATQPALPAVADGATELCLDGEFNIGARHQGLKPGADEFVATRWCVVTEDDSGRVLFSSSGKSNPDLDGSWTVAYLPPDRVRIVSAEDPPDIEFEGAYRREEALSVRRIDPRRLANEHREDAIETLEVALQDGRLQRVAISADLPLRGRVPVVWRWDWSDPAHPALRLEVDGETIYRGIGTWRALDAEESRQLWQATAGAEPTQVPGEFWPARINMRLVELADHVYLVRGVRTGFQHLVVETGAGLVVADAPAGWVELHQIPPADLVPGLGISGLSEQFVDFLNVELSGKPIRAVAITHAHDDHAGGARAFAAADADIYAPAEVGDYLERAFNRDSMPADRLSAKGWAVDVLPVDDVVSLDGDLQTVKLMSIGPGPHSSAALGIYAVEAGYFFVSDIHVPHSDDEAPAPDRAATECWFARWAVDHLPAETLVVNSHSPPETPVSTLGKYLESERCNSARLQPP